MATICAAINAPAALRGGCESTKTTFIFQQQFRSPTSRAARGMKEIGLDSLDLCPTGLGELVHLRFRVIPWLSVVKNPPRFANKMDRPIDFI